MNTDIFFFGSFCARSHKKNQRKIRRLFKRYMLKENHMKNIKISSIYICALLLVACTNQNVYELVRQNRLQECEKLPSSAVYDECIKQHKETYDEYERKRNSPEKNNT